MNSRFRTFRRLVILASIAPGCGPSTPALPPGPVNPTAVTDRRIRFKQEYKQAIGKDGRVRMNPGLMKKYQQSAKTETAKP